MTVLYCPQVLVLWNSNSDSDYEVFPHRSNKAMKRVVCILGVTGEHLGPELARWAVKKDSVAVRILVREGFQSVEKKKKIVDELVSLGCELHLGDASDVNSLLQAFTGADAVISSLGIFNSVFGCIIRF